MKLRNLLTLAFLTVYGFANAQLAGMNPNTGALGQTLQTTITGNGVFLQASSPSGNIYSIKLKQGVYEIVLFDASWWWGGTYINVTNTDTVVTDLSIPLTAQTGLYDLDVVTGDVMNPSWNQVLWTLPGAFTVLPPDGYITGTVYLDLDEDGTFDAGETPISSHTVKINPGNIILTTDASGNYSFPANNGSYTVSTILTYTDYKFHTSDDTIPVTIANNNSPGNNFGFKRALVSITPDSGHSALSATHQIVSDLPIFTQGPAANGNVSNMYLMSNPSVYVPASAITVIDSFTVWVDISIPGSVPAQINRDIRLNLTGPYSGYHYLKQVFDVLPPPALVSGKVFFDQNLNKLYDTGEPGISYAQVMLTPDTTYAFTNYSGDFSLGSDLGPHTLTYLNNNTGLVLFTDSASYTFNANGIITGKNFGLISTLPDYSVDLRYMSIWPRCNSQQNLYFTFRNTSNNYYTARAWIKKDPLMTYISSSVPPSSSSGDTTFWTFTNMAPYTQISLYGTYLLPGAGNVLDLEAGVSSLDANNIVQLTSIDSANVNVICALDPNDKQVIPEGIFAPHYTLMSDTLEYLIRFQNTGNDTAFRVVVLDTLDADLDYSTFEVLASSHSMLTELKSNGALNFTFEDIMLPDSNVNEPGSHGFIRYRINSDGGLADSTEIHNTAYIYFDFNAAVVTNTTLNTLVYVLPTGLPDIQGDNYVTLYPNPFSNTATLSFENPNAENYSLTITDISGKTVTKKIVTDENKFTIEKNQLRAGLYFYQLMNTDTQAVYNGKMVIQ